MPMGLTPACVFHEPSGELTLPVHARKRRLMTKGLWIVPEQRVCLPHGTQLSSCLFPGGAEICSVYLRIRGFKGSVHSCFCQVLPPTPLCLGPGSPESRVSATDWMCTVIWGPILGKRSEEWGDRGRERGRANIRLHHRGVCCSTQTGAGHHPMGSLRAGGREQ